MKKPETEPAARELAAFHLQLSIRSRYARTLFPLLTLLTLTTGCQVVTYTSATGERFSRTSFGSATSIQSLSVETGTNGLRGVELRGYQNDSTQALGAVTEAAVRAAVQSVMP